MAKDENSKEEWGVGRASSIQEVDKEDSGGMKFREASGIRKMKINLSEHFQILSKHPFLCSQCPLHITLPWYSSLCMEAHIDCFSIRLKVFWGWILPWGLCFVSLVYTSMECIMNTVFWMLSECKFCFQCYNSITAHFLRRICGAFNAANIKALPEHMSPCWPQMPLASIR